MPGGQPTTLNDLTASQKLVLRLLYEEPEEKYIGLALRDANIMAALGLARYAGSSRFELTDEGKELYYARALFCNQNKAEEITRSKDLDIGDQLRVPEAVSTTAT